MVFIKELENACHKNFAAPIHSLKLLFKLSFSLVNYFILSNFVSNIISGKCYNERRNIKKKGTGKYFT